MTENESREIIEAYVKCYESKTEVNYCYQCDKDCEACELNYEQGTVAEHREAMNMAIKSLEKMEKIKEIIDNANQWSKEDVVVKAQALCDIEKIVRSDTD